MHADKHQRHMPRADGFTLPELLVVLSIVAILLAAGLPRFHTYLQTQQVVTAAGQFLFALNLARSEAMQRGIRVDLVPRDGNNWDSGWKVFVNASGDIKPSFDNGATLIYSHEQAVENLRIIAKLSDKSSAYIAYNSNGRTRTNAGPLTRQWGSLKFSLNGHSRLIRINLAGRARLCNPDDDTSCRFSDEMSTRDAPQTTTDRIYRVSLSHRHRQ